eukprot:SM000271S10029  [mRNA]  locus=s271:43:11358:- [translate_table: standard]
MSIDGAAAPAHLRDRGRAGVATASSSAPTPAVRRRRRGRRRRRRRPLAEAQGFYAARTADALEAVEKAGGGSDGGGGGGGAFVRVPLAGVVALALSGDGLALAACTRAEARLYDVPGLLSEEQAGPHQYEVVAAQDSIKLFTWTPSEKRMYFWLSDSGELHVSGCTQILSSVVAASWSSDGQRLAMVSGSNNGGNGGGDNDEGATLRVYTPGLELLYRLRLPTNPTAGDDVAESSTFQGQSFAALTLDHLRVFLTTRISSGLVDSVAWLRQDSILVSFTQLSEDGEEMEGHYGLLQASSGDLLKEPVSTRFVAFPPLYIDGEVAEPASGPYLQASYFAPWNVAVVIHRKLTDDHINLVGWPDNKQGVPASLSLTNDTWIPRIELQGSQDSTLAGLAFDTSSTQLQLLDPRDDSKQSRLPPAPLLICMTAEGQLTIFSFNMLNEKGKIEGLVKAPAELPPAKPLGPSGRSQSQRVDKTERCQSEAGSTEEGGKEAKGGDGSVEEEEEGGAAGHAAAAQDERAPSSTPQGDKDNGGRLGVSAMTAVMQPPYGSAAVDSTMPLRSRSAGGDLGLSLFERLTKPGGPGHGPLLASPSAPPLKPDPRPPPAPPLTASMGQSTGPFSLFAPFQQSGASSGSFGGRTASAPPSLSPFGPSSALQKPSIWEQAAQSTARVPTSTNDANDGRSGGFVKLSSPAPMTTKMPTSPEKSTTGSGPGSRTPADLPFSFTKAAAAAAASSPATVDEVRAGEASLVNARRLSRFAKPDLSAAGAAQEVPASLPRDGQTTPMPGRSKESEGRQQIQRKPPQEEALPEVAADFSRALHKDSQSLSPEAKQDRVQVVKLVADALHSVKGVKVKDMAEELEVLVHTIQGDSNRGNSTFTRSAVEEVENGISVISRKLGNSQHKLEVQRAQLEDLRAQYMQGNKLTLDAWRIYSQSLLDQINDPLHRQLVETQELDPLLAQQRKRILKAEAELKRQTGELLDNMRATELSMHRQSGLPSSGPETLASLYNAINMQMAIAERLSRLLNKQMAMLELDTSAEGKSSTVMGDKPTRPAAAHILRSLGISSDKKEQGSESGSARPSPSGIVAKAGHREPSHEEERDALKLRIQLVPARVTVQRPPQARQLGTSPVAGSSFVRSTSAPPANLSMGQHLGVASSPDEPPNERQLITGPARLQGFGQSAKVSEVKPSLSFSDAAQPHAGAVSGNPPVNPITFAVNRSQGLSQNSVSKPSQGSSTASSAASSPAASQMGPPSPRNVRRAQKLPSFQETLSRGGAAADTAVAAFSQTWPDQAAASPFATPDAKRISWSPDEPSTLKLDSHHAKDSGPASTSAAAKLAGLSTRAQTQAQSSATLSEAVKARSLPPSRTLEEGFSGFGKAELGTAADSAASSALSAASSGRPGQAAQALSPAAKDLKASPEDQRAREANQRQAPSPASDGGDGRATGLPPPSKTSSTASPPPPPAPTSPLPPALTAAQSLPLSQQAAARDVPQLPKPDFGHPQSSSPSGAPLSSQATEASPVAVAPQAASVSMPSSSEGLAPAFGSAAASATASGVPPPLISSFAPVGHGVFAFSKAAQ